MGILKASLKDYVYYALPILITGFAYGWENGSLGGILAMPRTDKPDKMRLMPLHC